MLRDELPERKPATFCAPTIEKVIFRANYQRELDEFFARGGSIDAIPTPPTVPRPIREPRQAEYERGRKRAHAKLAEKAAESSSFRNPMHIRVRYGKSPQFIFRKKFIATFSTVSEAVIYRDKWLSDRGYPPAEY
jgi:hypothetical protein